MFRIHLLLVFAALLPLACKSSADEPSTDYGLLNLLGAPGIEHAAWQATAAMDRCQNAGDSLLGCANLDLFDKNTLKNNLIVTFSDTARLTGSLMIGTPHPDLLVPTVFTFSFTGSTRTGPESGSGAGQILTLTPTGTNPVTSSGVQARFDALTSNVARDTLQGTLNLTLPGTNPVVVTYSFNLTPTL